MDVNGTALVIGAGSGIGLEVALTFAERGARAMVFADLDIDAATRGSNKSLQIATAKDYKTLAVAIDVRDRASIEALVTETQRRFGRIDYAVNSAGVPRQVAADVSSVNEAEYDLLHDINAKGILNCLAEEIKAMKQQEICFVTGRSGRRSVGPGSIITVTSLAAVSGTANSTTYVASKFAARGIIKCAALENASSGLRINEVCPGFTDTPMLQRGIEKQPEVGEMIARSMPLGRVATAEEVANVVHFLASPGASFIQGQAIVVDSGVSGGKYS
ncbi:short-chain dehydrogenase/reductase SDR [Xylariaceae sp. FL0804]|nr:short-chain dehydrogenase/reductase SDR [Xylariaceae sp. FL0804]